MKLDFKAKTNEEVISITYECFRLINCFRFLSSSSDQLVKTYIDDNHKTLENLEQNCWRR